MKKLSIVFILLAFMLIYCGTGPKQEQTQEAVDNDEMILPDAEMAFLNNLKSLCGQSFRGQETFMQEGRESWADKELVMHVTVCEPDHVHIPFHIDDDHSRTWLFFADDGRLRFRHDHRHEDGTPEDETLYGGYSDGTGDAFRQHFPADDYTMNLLADTLNREWHVVLNEEMTNFSYRLLYDGEIVFQADFDLTDPL
ncbi:MAG: hypothetical protein ABR597_09985 [Bacteroidales bacterium]